MTGNSKIILTAQVRTLIGKKARKLRKENKIPAVIYGQDQENQYLTLAVSEFQKVYQQVGETGLIYVKFGDKEQPSIIRDHQTHPNKGTLLHVDFLAVNLAEKIEADIPLNFVGEAPAIKDLEGTLIEVKSEVQVEALPTDLVPEIEVDISQLQTFEDILHVKDIKAPSGITILDDPEETIATIEPPRSDEELAELEEKPEENVEEVVSETQEGTQSEAEGGEGEKKVE